MVNLRTLDLSLDDKYLKYANYGSTHSEHLPQCCLWTHGHHDVANAVLSVPRIENLKIRNSIQSIPVIISHHGEKLRKLSIFQDQELKFDAFSSHIPRVTPSEELLLQIARDCPKLTDLSLDAPSDSIALDWYLSCVANHLSFVQRLCLNFEAPSFSYHPQLRIHYDQCRYIYNKLAEQMQNNEMFQLAITAGAPISWDRIHWTAAPWYYKKRTYILQKRHGDKEPLVFSPEVEQSKYLSTGMLPEACFVNPEEVEHLANTGIPRQLHQLWGGGPLQAISCTTAPGYLEAQARKRLLQMRRDQEQINWLQTDTN